MLAKDLIRLKSVRLGMRLALLALLCAQGACTSDQPKAALARSTAPSRTVYKPPGTVASRIPPVAAAPAPTSIRRIDDEAITYLIEEALRRRELPGCVVAIGDAKGLHYLQAFGERTEAEPMTVDTRFDLASLTKPLATAASIMLLAERNVIDLSLPASSYLRELSLPDKRTITLAHLLLHTSGLPKVNALSETERGRAHARAAIAGAALSSRPGVRFDYSDLGYILLGEVVESVTSLGLDAFAASQLFGPLGMRDTHFRPAQGEAARYAPTELRDDLPIRGVVDDPRAYRLGGVAGHAGLFSTATDVARFARMLLGEGELDGVRVLSAETVRRFIAPQQAGVATRTLGFDVVSSYAHGRGRTMSARAFGHGGYTGTSLWLDPEHDLFVVLLSNRVHVGPGGTIHPLASSIADLALRARAKHADGRIRVGIDVLQEEGFARVRGRSVAMLSHLPARDAQGTSSLTALASAPEVTLKAILSPEHGLAARAEGKVASGVALGVPAHSLFGRTRKPTPKMLEGVDTIVIDLVDVGTRFYTYMATALRVVEAAAELDLSVLVLDRPNPLGGVRVEGPISEPAYASFVNYHPLPIRHGLTAGELLGLLSHARSQRVRMHVVKVEGWRRAQWFEDTGLTWHPPSPNLPTPTQALLYAATGLVEGTNLSVGRGTARAFAVVGAPFIKGAQLAQALTRDDLPGVTVAGTQFRPRVGPYAGTLVPGVAFEVNDAAAFSAAHTGLSLARNLYALYPQEWDATRLPLLVANAATMQALKAGTDLSEVIGINDDNLQSFQEQRTQALLYAE